jgi:hypothetical protein
MKLKIILRCMLSDPASRKRRRKYVAGIRHSRKRCKIVCKKIHRRLLFILCNRTEGQIFLVLVFSHIFYLTCTLCSFSRHSPIFLLSRSNIILKKNNEYLSSYINCLYSKFSRFMLK